MTSQPESEPERNRAVYVARGASDPEESDWMAVDFPFGLIAPPTFTLHRPLYGSVVFYHASAYGLIEPEASR